MLSRREWMIQMVLSGAFIYAGSRMDEKKCRLGLIGVPTNSSGRPDGVAKAPSVLREAGLAEKLRRHFDLKDYGELQFKMPSPTRDPKSGIIAPESAASMISTVAEAVSDALKTSHFPIVLGGDCPVLLGALQGAKETHPSLGLLFIDGHEDAYAPHESPTGELADMELGLALGRSLKNVPGGIASLPPLIDSLNVVILGARDADVIRKDGSHSLRGLVEVHSASEIARENLIAVTKQAIAKISRGMKDFWLHVDLDVLSSMALSAVDYPQPGGLNWEQLREICKTATASPSLAGIDITIYNPDLDPSHKQATKIVDFITEIVGVLCQRGGG